MSLCKEIKNNTIEKVKEKKELTKTYLQTKELIDNGKSLDEILELRELKDSTIIFHINELFENEYITKEQKDNLFRPMIDSFPVEIKEWIEVGLKTNDINTLKSYVNKYGYLF